MEEAALVLSRAPWCAGERPGMEEGALVWRRVPWCGGGRPGVDEDAWMPLERGGWRARFGGERLRRESSESTSDTSRKRTRLALRGRLMPRRREGRPPPAAPPCIRPWQLGTQQTIQVCGSFLGCFSTCARAHPASISREQLNRLR